SIRLLSARQTVCIYVEPVGGAFDIEAVDPNAVSLFSSGTGEVDRIASIQGKGAAGRDADRNGIADLPVCFTKADLRRLFSNLPTGRRKVPVVLEGPLASGGRLHAEFDLEVVAPGGSLATAVTPNPARAGSVLSFRLGAREPIRVRLFDAGGRFVRELTSRGSTGGGYHDVPFDGRDDGGRELRSGIYFYRVESEVGAASGRLVLVR
ncbi:MAG: T9SS type A sorting domain-containing protein, partial [Candidatus Eisenbacteria bacterium]